MNIIAWLILGGISGWLASLVMKTNNSQGMLMDIILGIVGGLVGGFAFNLLGFSGVDGLNIYSLVVSTIGAIALIALGRMFQRGTNAY